MVDRDAPTARPRLLVSKRYDYGHNPDGRPWLESVAVNGALVSSYRYDPNGNRIAAELTPSLIGYDAASDVSLAESETAYDSADKVITYGSRRYSWNNFGQLASVTDSASGATSIYDYDLFGNLLSVALPDGRTIEYDVDGAGRRIGRRVLDSAGNEIEFRGWIYRDLLRPIAEVDALGNVVARYVYADGDGPAQNGVDQLTTRLGATPYTRLPFDGRNVPEFMVTFVGTAVSGTFRFITNQVGTVVALVDVMSGEIVQRLEYDEFGRVLYDSNPGFQPFAFAGGLLDSATGLVRFGARDYESTTGRWTARDPIRFAGGDNAFVYVNSDPLSGTDPAGLACVKEEIDVLVCGVGAYLCVRAPSVWSCGTTGWGCVWAVKELQKCQDEQPPPKPWVHPYCRPGASPGPDSDECKGFCGGH